MRYVYRPQSDRASLGAKRHAGCTHRLPEEIKMLRQWLSRQQWRHTQRKPEIFAPAAPVMDRRAFLHSASTLAVGAVVYAYLPGEAQALTVSDVISVVTAVITAAIGATGFGMIALGLAGAAIGLAFTEWSDYQGQGELPIYADTRIGYLSGSGGQSMFPITVSQFAARHGITSATAIGIFKKYQVLFDATGPWGNILGNNYRLFGGANDSLAGYLWAKTSRNKRKFQKSLKAYIAAFLGEMRSSDSEGIRLTADDFVDANGNPTANGGTATSDGVEVTAGQTAFWPTLRASAFGIASSREPALKAVCKWCGANSYPAFGRSKRVRHASKSGLTLGARPSQTTSAGLGNGSGKWNFDGLYTASEATYQLARLIPGASADNVARWGAEFTKRDGLIQIGSPHSLLRLWRLYELFRKHGFNERLIREGMRKWLIEEHGWGPSHPELSAEALDDSLRRLMDGEATNSGLRQVIGLDLLERMRDDPNRPCKIPQAAFSIMKDEDNLAAFKDVMSIWGLWRVSTTHGYELDVEPPHINIIRTIKYT